MNKELQIQKIFHKIMRLSLAMVFAMLVVQVSASSILQKNVSIKLQNATIKSVLEEIQKQTGYSFVYNSKELEVLPKQTINITEGQVGTVLDKILKDTQFNYKVIDNTISITKTVAPKVTTVQPQEKMVNVKGKVLEADTKNPVVGATVLITGSSSGAITDDKGMFSFEAKNGQEIEITFVGMKSQKQKVVDNGKELLVYLVKDAMSVEDVIVTGAFERRTGTFTGSATTFKTEDLKRVGNQNVFQSLKNLDPSLMIFDNMEYGSDPNKNPKMSLRGVSSFSLGGDELDIKGTYGNDPNAPLFILDGFEASVQKVGDLDMNRIESLTILKDASAKAMYGSKAANGVIIIETKKSTNSALRINYRGSLEIQAPDLSSYNLTNAREKLEIEKDAGQFYSDNLDILYTMQREYNQKLAAVVSGIDTDWLAKPLRNGIGTKHSLGFEVGTDRLNLVAGFSYNNIKGTMKKSDRTTYEGHANISYRYKSLNFRNNLTLTSNVANDSPYGSFDSYARINPYLTPYDEQGRLVQNANIIPGADNFVANPLYNAGLNTRLSNEYLDFTNNTDIEWTVVQGLKVRGRFGISEKRVKSDEFYPANHLKFRSFSGDDFFRKGSYQMNEGDDKRLNGDANIIFTRVLGNKHYVQGNMGYTLSASEFEEIIYNAEGFPNDKMNDIIFAKQYVKDGKPTGRESVIRDMGLTFYGNYAYDDRYMFDGTYRTSASSQFGANSRWGNFWSTGIGWNIHKEKWFTSKEIDNLKISGSVGYTGSQNSNAYAAMATYKYILDQTYQGFLGSYLYGMRNDDLKWTEKLDYNVGVQFNWRRRLSIKAEYYQGKTTNNVLDIDIPLYSGFSKITENIGDVINKGFDITLSSTLWQNSANRSNVSVNASFSHNKNTISGVSKSLKNYNDEQQANGGDKFNNTPTRKYIDGVSSEAIWAVRSLGIDPADGLEIYLDKKGNITKQYSPANEVVCGNELPKLRGTFGLNFSHKGFDVNFAFRFQTGGQMYNKTLLDKVENADLNSNVDRRIYDGRWRKPGDHKPYKTLNDDWVAEANGGKGDYVYRQTQPTSRFVHNRNELTLGSVNVGYDFYRFNFIKKLSMERLRVFFYMNDVFTLSTIKIERGTSYPFARTFNFSLEATF